MSKILYFFFSICFKPHANPTVFNENIKEIHILVVGGDPGISNFKSHASPPWFIALFVIKMIFLILIKSAMQHFYKSNIFLFSLERAYISRPKYLSITYISTYQKDRILINFVCYYEASLTLTPLF